MAQGRVHHVPEFFPGQRAGGHPRRQLKAHRGANSLASAAIDHGRPRTHPHAPRVLVDATFDPDAQIRIAEPTSFSGAMQRSADRLLIGDRLGRHGRGHRDGDNLRVGKGATTNGLGRLNL